MTEKELETLFDFPKKSTRNKKKMLSRKEFVESARKVYEILKSEGKYDDNNGDYRVYR